METSIQTSQTSLIREAIASGTCGIKIHDHATKAFVFAKDMLEKEKTFKQLTEFEKSLEVEYKTMK